MPIYFSTPNVPFISQPFLVKESFSSRQQQVDNRQFWRKLRPFHLFSVHMIRAFLESIHVFAAEVDKSTLFLHKGTSNGMIALLLCNIEEDCILSE